MGGTNSSCADGYTGPFCGICQDGWSGAGGQCVECDAEAQASNPAFIVVAITLGIAILTAALAFPLASRCT